MPRVHDGATRLVGKTLTPLESDPNNKTIPKGEEGKVKFCLPVVSEGFPREEAEDGIRKKGKFCLPVVPGGFPSEDSAEGQGSHRGMAGSAST